MTTYSLSPQSEKAIGEVIANTQCAITQVTTSSWMEQFLTISFSKLNLFSFMLGVFFAISNATLRNMRETWTMLLLYVICVGVYFYFSR
jgi:hypothetical protein